VIVPIAPGSSDSLRLMAPVEELDRIVLRIRPRTPIVGGGESAPRRGVLSAPVRLAASEVRIGAGSMGEQAHRRVLTVIPPSRDRNEALKDPAVRVQPSRNVSADSQSWGLRERGAEANLSVEILFALVRP
jgi:hypothetical protein